MIEALIVYGTQYGTTAAHLVIVDTLRQEGFKVRIAYCEERQNQ